MLIEHDIDANFLAVNDADVLHVVLALGMIALGVIGTRLARDRGAAG